MVRHRVKKEDTLDPEELQDYLSKRRERRKERNLSKKQSKILSRQLYAQKKEFCCVGESGVIHVLRRTQHTRAGTGEAYEILRPLCNCQTHTSDSGCMLVTGPSEVYPTKATEATCTRCLKMLGVVASPHKVRAEAPAAPLLTGHIWGKFKSVQWRHPPT